MEFRVKLTEYATQQIGDIVSYISNTLLSPISAANWSDKLKSEISGLTVMPFRFAPVEKEPWHSKGIRKLHVGNFIAYYYVDETEQTVYVIAVVYGRRDQISALKSIPDSY